MCMFYNRLDHPGPGRARQVMSHSLDNEEASIGYGFKGVVFDLNRIDGKFWHVAAYRSTESLVPLAFMRSVFPGEFEHTVRWLRIG